LILQDEIKSLVIKTKPVIPACPESFPPQRKDSLLVGLHIWFCRMR